MRSDPPRSSTWGPGCRRPEEPLRVWSLPATCLSPLLPCPSLQRSAGNTQEPRQQRCPSPAGRPVRCQQRWGEQRQGHQHHCLRPGSRPKHLQSHSMHLAHGSLSFSVPICQMGIILAGTSRAAAPRSWLWLASGPGGLSAE